MNNGDLVIFSYNDVLSACDNQGAGTGLILNVGKLMDIMNKKIFYPEEQPVVAQFKVWFDDEPM